MIDGEKYVKSANLFNYQTMAGTIKGYYLSNTGTLESSSTAAVTDYIPCDGGVFTLGKVGGISPSICLYDSNKNFLYGQAYNTTGGNDKQSIFVNTVYDAKFIRFTYFYTGAPRDDLSAIMLNAGSTALPHEPYGNIWADVSIPTHKYVNGEWVDISPKQYVNGEWV